MDPTDCHHSSQKDRGGGALSRTLAIPSAGRTGHPRGERDQVQVWTPPRGSCNPRLGMLSARRGGGHYPRGGYHASRAIQFWNIKTWDEGYTTRPLSRYADLGYGSVPMWWGLARSPTCWFGKQVRQAWSWAWSSAWLAWRTLGPGSTPSAVVAQGRSGPANPT